MWSQELTEDLAKLQHLRHDRLSPNYAINGVSSKVIELICTQFLSSVFLVFFTFCFSHSSTLFSLLCILWSVTLDFFDKNGVETAGDHHYLEVFDEKV